MRTGTPRPAAGFTGGAPRPGMAPAGAMPLPKKKILKRQRPSILLFKFTIELRLENLIPASHGCYRYAPPDHTGPHTHARLSWDWCGH
jgi:hypothetical protein